MATTELSWKVNAALNELDRKLNYVQHTKEYVKQKCRQAVCVGAVILGIAGGLGGILHAGSAGIAYLFPEKKEAYETSRPKNNSVEQKYSALVERVCAKTSVDKRILLGLIAGGKTMHADGLRKDGYAGIIPLKPEEAGVTAETLSNDDEQCLLSAAQVFKKNAEKYKAHDLESAVGFFWHREKEAEAEKAGGGWQYITSAMSAADKRADTEWCAKRQELLQGHECALAFEKHLSTFPEGEREWRIAHASQILNRKITNPASLFCCKASIDAYERNRAGDEFTWIDLLPSKLASVISCSLAYMNGVEFKND